MREVLTIQTRIAFGAFVSFHVAVSAFVTWRTNALVTAAWRVRARSSILARSIFASARIRLTMTTTVSSRAMTSVVGRRLSARAAVQTRSLSAGFNAIFAIHAGESGPTLARVMTRSRIRTRGSVQARLVMRAEVQVCKTRRPIIGHCGLKIRAKKLTLIAKQSAPSFVALAFEGLGASSVDASRISDALLA